MRIKYFLALLAVSLLATSCVLTDSGDTDEMDDAGEIMEENVLAEPLSYDFPSVEADVLMTEAVFGDLITVAGLEAMADECGTDYEDGYFEDLFAQMEDETVYKYEFTYLGESQSPGAYTLSVVGNVPGYADLDAFDKDFGICAVGGGAYPVDMNENWLVFGSSCGSGYDDGSGLPHGCEEVKDDLDFVLN